MKYLSNEEKLELVLKFSKELNITAYEFGAHTGISSVAAHNILIGESKKPRGKTLDMMLCYIDSKRQDKESDQKQPITADQGAIMEAITSIKIMLRKDNDAIADALRHTFLNTEEIVSSVNTLGKKNEFISSSIDELVKIINDRTKP